MLDCCPETLIKNVFSAYVDDLSNRIALTVAKF